MKTHRKAQKGMDLRARCEVGSLSLGKVKGKGDSPNMLPKFLHGQIENTGKGIAFEEKLKSSAMTTLSFKYLSGKF